MMRELAEIRQELDEIDRQIVALYERRMMLSREVAQVKLAMGKPVLDANREEAVLKSRAEMLNNPDFADATRALYREIMSQSRGEQEMLLREAHHA